MANSRLTISYADYDREISAVSIRSEVVDNEVDLPVRNTQFNALIDAIGNVTLGLPVKVSRTYREENLAAPGSAAASPLAQREAKWLVRYFDNVSYVVGTFELPAADLSLLVANEDYMDISAGAGAALVTAIEAAVISTAGNPVTVLQVLHVGRNN